MRSKERSSAMVQGIYVALGALFGFVLTRAGATDFEVIHAMFRFEDLHLLGVIGVAVVVNAIGFALVRRLRATTRRGEAIDLATKPMTRGLAAGALAFGVGWGLSGTCPGTAIAQIGEGRLQGLVTFAGILLGAWLADRPGAARSSRERDPGEPGDRALGASRLA